MAAPRLIGTPLSHFTRKIRILALELGIEVDFIRSPGVLAPAGAAYGFNPLMRVPTLVDGQTTVIDSDHIARYLVRCHDPADRLGVSSEDVDDLNRLAVINGIMANEVVLILAKRSGGEVTTSVPYFGKLMTAIAGGLRWLDGHFGSGDFDYRDIATLCMWQHLEHYRLVNLEAYPRIAAHVRRFVDRPSVLATTPEISLAEATAAGWTPA